MTLPLGWNGRRDTAVDLPQLDNVALTKAGRFCVLSFACSACSPKKCRFCKRLPYHRKGATKTRRRKRPRSAKNSSLCKQCCCGACRKAPECAQEFAPTLRPKHQIYQILSAWRRGRDCPYATDGRTVTFLRTPACARESLSFGSRLAGSE
jgi:hypothetical protein